MATAGWIVGKLGSKSRVTAAGSTLPGLAGDTFHESHSGKRELTPANSPLIAMAHGTSVSTHKIQQIHPIVVLKSRGQTRLGGFDNSIEGEAL